MIIRILRRLVWLLVENTEGNSKIEELYDTFVNFSLVSFRLLLTYSSSILVANVYKLLPTIVYVSLKTRMQMMLYFPSFVTLVVGGM